MSREGVLEAQWQNIIQRHLDLIDRPPNDTVWPRDTLFDYFRTMESMQENMRERSDIINAINFLILQIFDCN